VGEHPPCLVFHRRPEGDLGAGCCAHCFVYAVRARFSIRSAGRAKDDCGGIQLAVKTVAKRGLALDKPLVEALATLVM
jgi:hypothetical protein